MTSPAPEHRREPSIGDWLGVIRDGWRALVVFIVLGALAGALGTVLQSSRYRATGSVLVTSSAFLDPSSASDLPTLATTVQQLADTAAVMKPAAEQFVSLAPVAADKAARQAFATPTWVQKHISVAQKSGSSILEISALAPTQQEANDLAVAVVETLAKVINEQSTLKTAKGTTTLATGVRVKIFTLYEPDGRVSPTPVRNLAVGANAGLIAGLIAALVLGTTRRRLRRPSDIAAELGLPSVAVFEVSEPGHADDVGLVELTSLLQSMRAAAGGEVVLLTGTGSRRRIATVAASLARSLVADQARAVLVDAELSQPPVAALGVVERVGRVVAEASGRAARPAAARGGRPEAEAASAGATAGEARGSSGNGRVQKLLRSQAGTYDFALVAGPPLDEPIALLSLVRSADRVLLVTERGVRARDLEPARILAAKLAGALVLD